MRRLFLLAIVFSVSAVISNDALAQRRIIELEIAASRFEPVETQQRWMQMLSKVGADRVRSKTSGSGTVKVTESELAGSVRVKVQGAINKGKLVLPARSFTIHQKTAIADYIQQLRDDGADVSLAEKKAFGLTSQQLFDLNSALKAKLKSKTLGVDSSEVVQSIKRMGGIRIVPDKTAKRALAGGEKVLDELAGFSAGTALAAIARPLGLVLVPKRKQGQEVELHLLDYRNVEEFWPIGWPADNLPRSALPGMYKKFPIEIRNAPLDQAINAVKARANVSMLFDHNSMAIAEIDLTKSNVTFVKESSNYINLLSKVLNQTKPRMDFEIRMDENGKPFLWMSTSNPVR